MSSILDDIRNEFNRTNNTVIKIVLVNLLVFVGVLVLKVIFVFSNNSIIYDWVMFQLGLHANLTTFLHKPWTLLTNFVVHEGFLHILFNMLFLYWFGQLLEEYIGGRRTAALYVLGGLAGSFAFLLIYNLVPYLQPSVPNATVIGASGAVFAIIVGAATLLPDYTFFLILLGPVRLKYIAAFYVLLSAAELVGSNTGGNLAHLAGALVGYGFIKSLQNGRDWGSPIYGLLELFSAIISPRPKPKFKREKATSIIEKYNTYNTGSSVNTPDQDEVDTILDKISKSGYDSLSKEEKQKLYKASQQ